MTQADTPFHIIKRSNAVEEILDTFKDAILNGALQPGQRLPSETELVEQLGVGRGTIREAMKMLRAMGVVNIHQGDGTYLADKPSSSLLNPLIFALLFTTGPGDELVELRALIEVGCYQLAAQKITPDDWPGINQAENSFATCARSTGVDVDHLARCDLDFHLTLLKATRNSLIIKIGRTVEEMFFASFRATLAKINDWETLIAEHKNIVQAIQTGQADQIQQAVRLHLAHWGQEVRAEL